tara:strand:- start:1414 stop:2718 length:1305 start_codon:yes stop_codon:yes gene_type:complete
MADPKQLASLLSEEEELRRFNAAQGDQPWYSKALPMEGRATLLPFRDTMEGSVFNKRELALPGILAGALNAFTSPARALTGSDPTFKSGEEAANMALNTFGGGIATGKALTNPTGVGGTDLALNAWHGTPHEIKGNFDISKVGTGEGAQSYGHGMYFGEARGTGEEYRKILSSKVDVNGKPLYRNNNIVGSTGNKELDDYLIANIGDVKATKKQLLSDIKEIRTGNPVAAKEMQQTLLDLRNANVNSVSGGNLYKVDIPDAAIPMMLNWDQPLAKQMPEVLNLLKNNPAVLEDLAKGKTLEQLTGADAYKAIASSFDVGQKEAYKLASEYLASQGIPGIKYYDQVSRKSNVTSSPRTQLDAKIEILQKDVASGLGNQEYLKRQLANLTYERDKLPTATSNFVMFDPSTVKILEKNDVPVTRKDLLKQEFDKLEK